MYHYTYLIINNTSGKLYIGVRSSKCLPEEDTKYMGSSKILKSAIELYGLENFTKFILKLYSSRIEAELEERFLLKEYDVENNDNFYNICCGRYRGAKQGEKILSKRRGWHHTEEAKDKIRQASTGRCHTEDTKKKISNLHIGQKLSEDTKKKISETKKGSIPVNKGVPHTEETKEKLRNLHKGKIIAEDTKKKISEALKGREVSEETRNKLRLSSTGRKHTKEAKEKIVKALTGTIQSEETKLKRSKAIKDNINSGTNGRVVKVTDTVTGITYNSMTEASLALGKGSKYVSCYVKRHNDGRFILCGE